LSGAIKGRDNVYNHIDSMLQNAKKSVILVTGADGFVRKIKFLRNRLKRLSSKGVKIKIGTKINDEVKKLIKELKNIQIKNVNINARFCIVDGKEVMFMINDEKIHENYDSAVWVNTPYFATALENLFNICWRS